MKRLLFALSLLLSSALGGVDYVTVDFIGCQFGNQLFQIAAALSLAIDNGAEAVFPQLLQKRGAGFPKNYREVFFRLDVSNPKLKRRKYYVEQQHHYVPIPYQPNLVIKGCFQSEKFFAHNSEKILPLFAPSESIAAYLDEKYGKLLSEEAPVGLHLRSYLMEAVGVQRHLPTYGEEYYRRAMECFPDETLFLIFSNDIPWSKKLLANIGKKMLFVEGNDYLQDFFLLARCSHQIVSNSTFSWWAAYLNSNVEKRVIAPPHFFRPGNKSSDRDLFPERWERIGELKDPFLPIRR